MCTIEIAESEQELKNLLRQQKTASGKERIHLLYLLKSKQVESVTAAASLLGRHRVTLERWLGKYRQAGLAQLLAPHSGRGRQRHIQGEVAEKLQVRLQEPQGFDSYGAVQHWLEQNCGVKVSYGVVHQHVRYRLKAKLKVPRPVSRDQDAEQVGALKKTWVPT